MAGPRWTARSPGSLANASTSAPTPASTTPAAVPRQPACRRPTTRRPGSAMNTGTQSASVTVRRTPVTLVACPSPSPVNRTPRGNSPWTRTEHPCTCRLLTTERQPAAKARSSASGSSEGGAVPAPAGQSPPRARSPASVRLVVPARSQGNLDSHAATGVEAMGVEATGVTAMGATPSGVVQGDRVFIASRNPAVRSPTDSPGGLSWADRLLRRQK